MNRSWTSFLSRFLTPSYVSRPPEVQPVPATVGGVYYSQGPTAVPPIPTQDLQTVDILTVPPVGFSEPNPVLTYGDMPQGFIPGETGVVLENDSQGGAC